MFTLIYVLLLTCNGLHADETCSPDYPDQFPFYPERECDDVTPLGWETDNPNDPIDNNSSKTIFVTGGGVSPLTIQVEGQGFWLDPGRTTKSSVIDTQSFTIYTSEACGPVTFHITDGCSLTNGVLRSSQGVWNRITDGSLEHLCGVDGEPDGLGCAGGQGFTWTNGKYKIRECARSTASTYCWSCNGCSFYITCFSKESLTPGGTILNEDPCECNDYWQVDYGGSIGSRCRQGIDKRFYEWGCAE